MGLGGRTGLGHVRGMSRIAIAAPLGILGFFAYVALVVALADHVLALHWVVQAVFFLVAGIVWAFPAKWLMFWAAGQR
ncbi:MAG: hypothetical protein JWP04_837 [Belnapia sp.]|jgi:hypothetical protein|nr:hypothetical protein [Belnapia sp.]